MCDWWLPVQVVELLFDKKIYHFSKSFYNISFPFQISHTLGFFMHLSTSAENCIFQDDNIFPFNKLRLLRCLCWKWRISMWLQPKNKWSSKATNAQKMAPSPDVNNDVVWNNPISPQQPSLDLFTALNVSLSTSVISMFASAAWFCAAFPREILTIALIKARKDCVPQ